MFRGPLRPVRRTLSFTRQRQESCLQRHHLHQQHFCGDPVKIHAWRLGDQVVSNQGRAAFALASRRSGRTLSSGEQSSSALSPLAGRTLSLDGEKSGSKAVQRLRRTLWDNTTLPQLRVSPGGQDIITRREVGIVERKDDDRASKLKRAFARAVRRDTCRCGHKLATKIHRIWADSRPIESFIRVI